MSVQFNSERFFKMDLNTATYSELLTLLNIGEVRAASIVMVRESLERIGRKLTLLDLTLDCGIPGDVVKNLTVNGDIQPIPRHEDSCMHVKVTRQVHFWCQSQRPSKHCRKL